MAFWSSDDSRAHVRAPARSGGAGRRRASDGRTDGRSRSDQAIDAAVDALSAGAYRYRRELAPPAVVAGLLATTLAAHALSRHRPWLALLVGGTAAAVVAGGMLKAKRERLWIAAFGFPGALWAWLATAVGWWGGPLMELALLPIAAPAAWMWWNHQIVRSRIVVAKRDVRFWPMGEWDWRHPHHLLTQWAWGEEQLYRRRTRSRLKELVRDWPATATEMDVPGSWVHTAEGDRAAFTLDVRLRPGTTHQKFIDHGDHLGSSLGALRGTLKIEPKRRMNEVRIRWVHDDPLKAPLILWRPYEEENPVGHMVTSIRKAVQVGLYVHGEPVEMHMTRPLHTLVCGMPRRGKTAIVRTLFGSLAGAPDVVLWAVDPKDGVEFGPLEPVLDRRLSTPQALQVLRAAWRLIAVRTAKLKAAGVREWNPALGPYLLIALDEFSEYSKAAKWLALKLAQKCLFVGIQLIVITQIPSKGAMGESTDLKENLGRRISLYNPGDTVARMIFGDDCKSLGWDPTKLLAWGSFQMRGDGADDPVEARGLYPDDEAIRMVVERERCTHLPPDEEQAIRVLGPVDVELARDDDEEDEEPVPVSELPQMSGGGQPTLAVVKSRRTQAQEEAEANLAAVLKAAVEADGPLSGNQLEELSEQTQHFIFDKKWPSGARGALRELERRNLLVEDEGGKWTPTETATEQASS